MEHVRSLTGVVLWMVSILGGFSSATAAPVYIDDFAGDSSKGRFVMEAEHYARRDAGEGGGWWEVDGLTHRFIDGPEAGSLAPNAVPEARGSYMEVLAPIAPLIPPTDSAYSGSIMEYHFSIRSVGAYRLYVRWRGEGPFTDSLYASIWTSDGTLLADSGPEWFTYHQWRQSWYWDFRGVQDSTTVAGVGFPHEAIWTIVEPGIYTLRISQREAESALDAMVFQTLDLASPTGLGPPESRRMIDSAPAIPALQLKAVLLFAGTMAIVGLGVLRRSLG